MAIYESEITQFLKQLKQERFDAAEKAEEMAKKEKKDTTDAMVKAMKSFNSRLERVDKYRSELAIHWALATSQTNEAIELLREAKDLPLTQRARLWQDRIEKR